MALRVAALAALLSMAALAAPASAGLLLTFGGDQRSTSAPFDNPFGISGTASLTFSTFDASGVLIDVVVTNASAAPVTRAELTGFGFDLVPGTTYRSGSFGFVLNSDGEGLDAFSTNASLSSVNVDLCAFSGNNCGGSPGNGISIGDSSAFSIVLSTALTAADVESAFFDVFRISPTRPQQAVAAARFQRTQINGSGDFSDTLYGPTVVPLPAPALLLLGGVSALGFAGYRRKEAASFLPC